jgi:hypothetical protein
MHAGMRARMARPLVLAAWGRMGKRMPHIHEDIAALFLLVLSYIL